ncbi:MAG: ribonuclease III [Chlamydiales bacterium]|nr:ribonuclease III [Chlamydiales bacterium]
MDSLDELQHSFPLLQQKLNYFFQHIDLLVMACCHSSYVNENKKKLKNHNERLEFLGDSVLGMIICEYLYDHYVDLNEGSLSNLKAKLVDAQACYHYIEKLDIEAFLLLGKGEYQNLTRGRQKLLANFFEALIGSIFLDGGFSAAKHFFLYHFEHQVAEIAKERLPNYKADLQELTQEKDHLQPHYVLVHEEGPEHEKIFRVEVYIQDQLLGSGEGKSKKLAEQQAAKVAIDKYRELS